MPVEAAMAEAAVAETPERGGITTAVSCVDPGGAMRPEAAMAEAAMAEGAAMARRGAAAGS